MDRANLNHYKGPENLTLISGVGCVIFFKPHKLASLTFNKFPKSLKRTGTLHKKILLRLIASMCKLGKTTVQLTTIVFTEISGIF